MFGAPKTNSLAPCSALGTQGAQSKCLSML
jgi:hypothetical protein